MAATLITSQHPSHHGHYGYAQPPPSPPMEDSRCSLPSISNLLGLADAGSPTSESSPISQRPSPQPEVASHIKTESRPSSGYGKHSHHRGLPPTPPMSTDASFDGYTSPSTRSVSHFSSGNGHYYETTPPLEADLHRPAPPPLAAPRATFTQQPPAFHAAYISQPQPPQAYYATPPPQPQPGLYYQRALPQSFPPPAALVLAAPAPVPAPAPGTSSANPWQHHHYLNPTGGPSFPQSQDRYVCQTCSKAFSRPSSLRIHSHSHTGEKPFKCPHAGCGKAFSVRSNMKRHERGCHSFEIRSGLSS